MSSMPSGLTITVLGSGTSHGVPMIACRCDVCTSTDPKDRRSRPSIAVQHAGTTLLIDTGPELRLQCIANNITRVDAVLYTHHHIDHIAGLDDLRRFNWVQKQVIPCYGRTETLDRLTSMFAYAFAPQNDYPSATPRLSLQAVNAPFEIHGLVVTPIPLFHGTLPILGFRIGDFAYCTDVSRIPPESWPLLSNLDTLMLDALRKRPHPTHFNLDQAIQCAGAISARRTFFTHIAHELAHQATNQSLPPSMALAYDGQIIAVGPEATQE